MDNPKYKVGDILKPKSGIIQTPQQIRVVEVYHPPYRGKDRYGYKLEWLRESGGRRFWEHWAHQSEKGLSTFYELDEKRESQNSPPCE